MHTPRRDSSGVFVIAVAAGPMVLPVLGVHLSDLLFAVPLVVLPFTTWCALLAAKARPDRAAFWHWIVAAAAVATAASALGLATVVTGHGETAGLYVGFASSACLLIAGAVLAAGTLRKQGWLRMVDPLLLLGALVSLAAYLLIDPGFEHGDAILTGVELLDVLALVLIGAGMVGRLGTRASVWLMVGMLAVCLGDSVAAAGAAHMSFIPTTLVPVLWAVAGWALAAGARSELAAISDGQPAPAPSRSRTYATVLLPVVAIVAYPVIVAVIGAARGAWLETALFFAAPFFVSTVVAFSRQAVVLVEQREAAVRERWLRAEADSRNRQLEALTGLATTMTEVLEERPVVERGLEALRVAARSTSSSLHLLTADDKLELVATTGCWGADREWARVPSAPPLQTELERRGRRDIARLPVTARGRTLGFVTLVRPEREGRLEGELDLLGLLVDQLAVALQNARDYHDKLEAAIRDPLTGLYNRRFFYEAFEMETARHDRYGGGAALVLFDIDDFKQINDTLGHAAGDEVLLGISRIADGLVRPSDTFARVGGEEFGLLMPETGQLDALLVAERLRTAVARAELLPGRTVTLSGGIAALPHDGTTREELERRADLALYWAKRNGKNLCAVASEAITVEEPGDQVGMLAHLHGVVAGIDSEQLHTLDHSENVALYAVSIGQALGIDSDRMVRVRRAALLHDVGKVAVPGAILSKPGPLTEDEFDLIRLHPDVGATMLHHAGLHLEAEWVRAHHERLDGRGYPDGLDADEIPIEARIIFVADSFEAMTSDRPYRRGVPVAEAVEELRRCAGTQFDPDVVEALAELIGSERLTVQALRNQPV
jgi:diguanylate cyclase (GGDEF)-like protein/putative nucleotidyltransferase with HDIG domain